MKNSSFMTWIGLIGIFSLTLVGCTDQTTKPVTLTILSGTSLKNSLLEIKDIYAQQEPRTTLIYKFGNSGTHQKAIEQGDKADIYITGGLIFMDNLQSQGLIFNDSRRDFLKNKMVLIVPKNSTGLLEFKDLTNARVKKVALSASNLGSSGKYALESLTYLGILDAVKPKFVLTKSGTDALRVVENGKADAGLLFATDAIGSNQIKIVAIAPDKSHFPIIYSVAVLKKSSNTFEAKKFIQFLESDLAESIFVKYGFVITKRDKAEP